MRCISKKIIGRNHFLVAGTIGILFAVTSMASSAANVQPFKIGSMAGIVRHHAQQPFIVHFWSLECAPCIDELPSWSLLTKTNPGVDVILVSTDSMTDRNNIINFLQSSGLSHLPSWVFNNSSSDQLRFDIDRTWYGELPRTYFYSPNGKVTAVSGTMSSKNLESWIRKQVRDDDHEGKDNVIHPRLH